MTTIKDQSTIKVIPRKNDVINKGWYVIWCEDTEEYRTKKEALKRAKEIYNAGLDHEVFIQAFNDNNPNGYFAGEETIFIKNLI